MEKDKVKIGVIGLGYVGLPLACLFSKRYPVVGYDRNERRIRELNSGDDKTGEVSAEKLSAYCNSNLMCVDDPDVLKDCTVYVVCVPTPVDKNHNPDLSIMANACELVGKYLKKDDIVIYESSVYPGCTEDMCVPILSKCSGLEYNKDFGVGYSPERINPGDKEHTVEKIKKVVAGSAPWVADFVEELYNSVLLNGTCRASSIKVAEATKVVENTQRDINIAFMNELCRIFKAMDINMPDVLRCASTKWNFMSVRPGLVGGHCIGVDPYYLIHCAQVNNVFPQLLMDARNINESMGHFMAGNLMNKMEKHHMNNEGTRILLLGFAFKADCSDIRNTKVEDVYYTLRARSWNVEIYDPLVNPEEVKDEYGIQIITDIDKYKGCFDVVMLCVSHKEFLTMDIRSLVHENGIVHDAMNVLEDADYYL